MSLNYKKILAFTFLTLFTSITYLYSQTESEKINVLIKQKRSYNKTNKVSTVYKIQLFNGTESKAYSIKNQFKAKFPEYKVQIIYVAPEWKTQIGNFLTRIEADRILNIIKEKFVGAFVLEDKI